MSQPPSAPPRVHLSRRYELAVGYAAAVHMSQLRKGTGIPYMSHLLGVSALVLEQHGDEDQAIAGLLHDAPEDQGGLDRLEDIRVRFGERVAEIVAACTDTYEDPKPPWRERKERYIAHLAEAPREALLVSLADKVHNTRALLFDYRSHGETLWDRFHATREQTLWYYRTLAERFHALVDDALQPFVDELDRTVAALAAEIERTTGERV